MEYTKGVIFIIKRPDNSMLLQLRDEKSVTSPLMWCFPGGASDNNESYEDTVIREVKEEFCIDILKKDIEMLTTFPHENNHVFICHVPQYIKPKLFEGKDMGWFSVDEIKNKKLGFDQNRLVKEIEEYIILY